MNHEYKSESCFTSQTTNEIVGTFAEKVSIPVVVEDSSVHSKDLLEQIEVETRPNVFFLCMHKAASTFVADVLFQSIASRTASLESYLVGSFLIKYINKRKEEGLIPAKTPQQRQEQLKMLFRDVPLPVTNGLIGRFYPGHIPALQEALSAPLPSKHNRMIIMRRDPRDALVSLYYSMSFSHSPKDIEGDNTGFLANRKQLQSQNVREGLKTVLRKRGLDSTMPEFLRCTDLILANNNICDLPYELLVNDPGSWLASFVEFAELQEFVDDQWFEEMTNHLHPPAIEDPNSHKRRIKPGNWMEVFDDELKEMVCEKLGSRLEQFGYCW